MRKILILVCLIQLSVSYPTENPTEIKTETDFLSESNFDDLKKTEETKEEVKETTDKIKEKIESDTKLEDVKDEEDKLKKTYLNKLGNKNAESHFDFPGNFRRGPNPFAQKKMKPFSNFPPTNGGPNKKANYMLNLFFGKDPLDVDIVEEKSFQPYHDDQMKEPLFYPSYYAPQSPEMSPAPKFDSFPYEKLAQPYDRSQNPNTQKQEFLNKEYTFKPFFADAQEDLNMENAQRNRDMERYAERYEYMLNHGLRSGQNWNSDTKFVFHPRYGYIPTDLINEDDDIMDEINPDQIFEFVPPHGYVPVMNNNDNNNYNNNNYNNYNNGPENYGYNYDPEYDNSGNSDFMMKEEYGKRYEMDFDGNFNHFGGQDFNRPQMQENRDSFNNQHFYPTSKTGGSPQKPVLIKALKPEIVLKPEVTVIETEITKPEKEMTSDDYLKRDRRQQQTLIPQFYYQTPYPTFVQPAASMYYQPQYFYNPVVRPEFRNVQPQFVNRPIYTLTEAMKARQGDAETDTSIADVSTVEESEENNLPVDPPGALVANEPLSEKFPIFPYDPDQDKPAAVAF